MGDPESGLGKNEHPIRNVPLWQRTSLRVGGPAAYFAEPSSVNALRRQLVWGHRRGIPVAILGGGTNVIFPDAGYDGLVLHTGALRGRSVEEYGSVRVAAGERLAAIAWWAAGQGLAGLEWAAGIPGTIGGAVTMNAGTRDGEMAERLVAVDWLRVDGRVESVPAAALGFGYRTSSLQDETNGAIVVAATIALDRDDPDRCIARARSTIEERLGKLPLGASAGSIFRNPPSGPTAGQLLDHAGCKGLRVGEAVVSSQHANVIVNEGYDNGGDVIELIEQMKQRVNERHGVELTREVVVFS